VMDAPDTRKSSAITDHPFEPRTQFTYPKVRTGWFDDRRMLPPTPYLCGHDDCNLAEAAHSETTVKR
jgi:hypothetical protein